MPDDSAVSTTRRVSIGQRLDGRSDTIAIDGTCTCREPLTDTLVGARRTGDDDDDDGGICWRCRRPVREA